MQNLISDALHVHILAQRHTGYVTHQLDETIASFMRVFGLSEHHIRREPHVAGATARFAFISFGQAVFEIIEPCAPEMKHALDAHASGSGGINHIAFTVRDLPRCLDLLSQCGVLPGHVTPHGMVSFSNRRLVYLDPGTTGGLLVELVEDVD